MIKKQTGIKVILQVHFQRRGTLFHIKQCIGISPATRALILAVTLLATTLLEKEFIAAFRIQLLERLLNL